MSWTASLVHECVAERGNCIFKRLWCRAVASEAMEKVTSFLAS